MKVVIVPALSFVATAGKKYRPVAAVLIHVFTAVGFMAAAHPDEIGGSYHHDFCRMFGMIILTNLTLMALTGRSPNLTVPFFSLSLSLSQPCLFLLQPDVSGG
jgi:protein-S-isoprenylcysteine O-methyltransferase Ste14